MIQQVSQIVALAQTIYYELIETPNLPCALGTAKDLGCPVDRDSAVLSFWRAARRLLRWRLPLFAFLFRNSARAVDLVNLPPRNFLEIGREIEI
jgi:KUP system potassium uptake protein